MAETKAAGILMRLAGAIACALVGFDCFNKATGLESQRLLGSDAIWLWWVFGLLWLVMSFRFLFGEIE
jgi:hypothetical protein